MKRTSPRSTSDKFIVADKHIQAVEALYIPTEKERDPEAPAGMVGIVSKTDPEGKTRAYLQMDDEEIALARKDEVSTVGGTPVLNYEYGFAQGTAYPAPRPGQEQTPAPDSRLIIYVDRDSTEIPKAQYTWSSVLNEYQRYNSVPASDQPAAITSLFGEGIISYE